MARKKGVDYSDRPWKEIQHRYETGQAGPKALSELYGIPYTTLTRRANRERWTRAAIMPTDRQGINKPGTDSKRPHKAKVPTRKWAGEKLARAVESIANWFDDLDEGDDLTVADFCRSKHNLLGIKPTQMIHLFSIPEFREQWDTYKPLLAERIAKGAYTLKNGKSTPLSIFWLKQFGWTDRQEITTIDAGASIDAAISRAYDVTPKK